MTPRSIENFYRVAVWLPLAIPVIVAGVVHGLGFTTEVEPVRRLELILLASLLYGGLPYSLLALWATSWSDGRPESEIRRLACLAPLLMTAIFLSTAALVGITTGNLVPFLMVGLVGGVYTVALGYMYVSVVLLLRKMLGPPAIAHVEESG